MTEPQHMAAVRKANRVRLARVDLKRRIAALSREEAFELLAGTFENPPEFCQGMTPFDLLMFVRRMGRRHALTWIRKAGLSEARRIRELTERQRMVLAAMLREGERLAA